MAAEVGVGPRGRAGVVGAMRRVGEGVRWVWL